MTSNSIDSYDNFEVSEDHLELLDSLPKELKEILDRINTRKPFYMYNQAKEIIRLELDPRFRDADQDMNDRGRILFLYGDYNSGKSYLLRYSASLFKEKYRSYWDNPEETHPIIIVNLTNDINTAKQLLLFLLDQLGRPIDPRQVKNWEKTNVCEVRLRQKLISVLESYKTRLLIIDECQRLLKSRNPDIPNIFEALKDLTTKSYWKDSLRTYFLLCGTQDGLPLLDAADWIQGRAHSIKLRSLPQIEYGNFLWAIHEDFTSMGISDKWNLVIEDKSSENLVLNPEIAMFLYKRSYGKAGLTVELIKYAAKRALNAGRLYPDKDDYGLIILEGVNYETLRVEHEDGNELKIVLGFEDRLCKIKGCKRSRSPYKTYRNLINHYKMKHKNIKLVNREGDRI
ncbi:MAG: TniB family NTP-binding protein [Promethearchaeota archaeon]